MDSAIGPRIVAVLAVSFGDFRAASHHPITQQVGRYRLPGHSHAVSVRVCVGVCV